MGKQVKKQRKPGSAAPLGNQNAVKHGLYAVCSDAFSEAEKEVYEQAETDPIKAAEENIKISKALMYRALMLTREYADRQEEPPDNVVQAIDRLLGRSNQAIDLRIKAGESVEEDSFDREKNLRERLVNVNVVFGEKKNE